ncbi:HEL241Cp [Eremothecium sinecaudum]|uniref:HEL241Cp n=1 Tax=Eremothecium sinecaudum TaxID=45286 RepID=A0A0X8HT78_9SACH|nr:HEL241Cp [Eremothecium sinecaudum]AMD21040.1 HEL241Cp [Eremothecium sinecaudum]
MDNTPKRTRRSSFSDGDADKRDHGLRSPQTPSPPGSSAKHGKSNSNISFKTSPLQNTKGGGVVRNGSKTGGTGPPQSPSSRVRLLPPTTPKSRISEAFLSPSPALQSPASQPIPKDNDKPIRAISNNLKTRLNYAFVKLQNGWQNKTLPELETELEGTGSPRKRHGRSPSSTSQPLYQYSNKYATSDGEEACELDDSMESSAQSAFLKALSSPAKKPRSVSRSGITPPFPNIPSSTSSRNQPSEVEAIETLMSLSTSQKRQSHGVRDVKHTTGEQTSFTSSGSLSSNANFPGPAKYIFPPAQPAASVSGTLSSPQSDPAGGSPKKELVKPLFLNTIDNTQQTQQTQHHDPHQPLHHPENQTDVETDIEDPRSSDTNDEFEDNDK